MPNPPLSEQMRMGQALRKYVSYNPLNYVRPARRLRLSPSVIMSEVDITDVSFYQKLIDFNVMKAAGAKGTIIRAGQNVWEDPYFDANWVNAKSAGVPRGSYFLFDSRVTPKSQADLYWSMVKNDLGELFHTADFEEVYGGPYGGWRNLYDFLERLCSNGMPREKLWIYTGYYYWLDHSPQTNQASLAYFGNFPLWLAWYTENPALVKIPKPWLDATLWQRGTPPVGKKYGVQTIEIDMSKWTGDLFSYLNYFHLDGGVLPPPTQENGMKYTIRSTVSTETRAIRRGPSVIFGSVMNLPAGAVATGDFKFTHTQLLTTDGLTRALTGDEWYHITAPVDGWIARVHMGQLYTIVTELPSVPDSIASVSTSQEMVITHTDGRVETFRGQNIPLPKV